jgi:protein-S-isoprenylcysteine O-methyltransferase Ste14
MASALPLVFTIAAIVLLGVTGNLFSSSLLASAAQVGAVALSVWARRSFDKGTFRVGAAPAGVSIIRRGPYRVIRHPMYSSALLVLWAGVVSHVSAFTLTIGIAGSALVVARVLAEERLLQSRFPDYRDYARSTKALVPFLF